MRRKRSMALRLLGVFALAVAASLGAVAALTGLSPRRLLELAVTGGNPARTPGAGRSPARLGVGPARAATARAPFPLYSDAWFDDSGIFLAVQFEAPVIVIVADNGIYGTIRMHQERHYPGRISATQLRNPDFAAYARAFGGFGVTVERTADFPAAFQAAEQSGLPAIIHLKVDPEAITPTTTLAKIRETALAQHDGG